jgi:hypothetical protein
MKMNVKRDPSCFHVFLLKGFQQSRVVSLFDNHHASGYRGSREMKSLLLISLQVLLPSAIIIAFYLVLPSWFRKHDAIIVGFAVSVPIGLLIYLTAKPKRRGEK